MKRMTREDAAAMHKRKLRKAIFGSRKNRKAFEARLRGDKFQARNVRNGIEASEIEVVKVAGCSPDPGKSDNTGHSRRQKQG